jgi:hypothetical protein
MHVSYVALYARKRLLKMLYSLASLLLLTTSTSAAVVSRKAPAGFVTTKGNVFKLDGKDFYFAGSNAYYFPFNDVSVCYSKLATTTDTR